MDELHPSSLCSTVFDVSDLVKKLREYAYRSKSPSGTFIYKLTYLIEQNPSLCVKILSDGLIGVAQIEDHTFQLLSDSLDVNTTPSIVIKI